MYLGIKNIFKMVDELQKSGKLDEMIQSIRTSAEVMRAFIVTYMGEYDSKGNQIRKGDRDYIFESLEKIEKELEELKKKVENMQK